MCRSSRLKLTLACSIAVAEASLLRYQRRASGGTTLGSASKILVLPIPSGPKMKSTRPSPTRNCRICSDSWSRPTSAPSYKITGDRLSREEKSSNESKVRETEPASYTVIDPCTIVEFVMMPVLTRDLSPAAEIISISGGEAGGGNGECLSVPEGHECPNQRVTRSFSQRSGCGRWEGKVTDVRAFLCRRLHGYGHRTQ